ncbi:MAG: murein biosynthesis integral membrane protein MurJ, partial [Pseudomonadota bacterium]
QRSPAEVKLLLHRVAGSLGGVLCLVTLFGVLAAPLLVLLFAPGFIDETEKYNLAVDMLRIMFPYLLFISLTAFAGAILNTYGYFAAPAFTPVLLNICMIGAALGFTGYFEHPITALAWAVFIAGLIQFGFQLPFLYRLDRIPRPSLKGEHEGVKRILKLMLPALFGVSVTQINLLIDTLMASFLFTGSVSWLYFADRLLEFPVGVFGVALATVILPSLSSRIAENANAEYQQTLNWALRWVFLIGLPCTAGLMILSGPIMATLFNRGQFTDFDTLMSAQALMAYSAGLMGFVLIKVLASGFFSRQDTRTPVITGAIAMAVNVTLNLILVWSLAHVGLALATACGALTNAGLLYWKLRQAGFYQPEPGWWKFFAQTGGATIAMSLVLMANAGTPTDWLEMSGFARFLTLGSWIFAGMIVYLACLLATGVRPRDLLKQ